MRYFAVTLLLAAMGAAGYLAWTGLHQTPEVIPSARSRPFGWTTSPMPLPSL